jgi:hypothetical protein
MDLSFVEYAKSWRCVPSINVIKDLASRRLSHMLLISYPFKLVRAFRPTSGACIQPHLIRLRCDVWSMAANASFDSERARNSVVLR